MNTNNKDFNLLVLHALNRAIEVLGQENNALLELWDLIPHSDDIIADEEAMKDTILMWSLLVSDLT